MAAWQEVRAWHARKHQEPCACNARACAAAKACADGRCACGVLDGLGDRGRARVGRQRRGRMHSTYVPLGRRTLTEVRACSSHWACSNNSSCSSALVRTASRGPTNGAVGEPSRTGRSGGLAIDHILRSRLERGGLAIDHRYTLETREGGGLAIDHRFTLERAGRTGTETFSSHACK